MADVLATEEATDAGSEPTTGYWASFAAVLETVDDIGSSDTSEPVISGISPSPGSSISQTEAISFTINDAEGANVVIVVVGVIYPDGTAEWVYDGTTFFVPFATASTATPRMDGGFDFVVVRDGGWPAVPTFRVRGVDALGNV